MKLTNPRWNWRIWQGGSKGSKGSLSFCGFSSVCCDNEKLVTGGSWQWWHWNLKELPPWKPTWQWKNNNLKMYLVLKMVIFHCHVFFRGCIPPKWWSIQSLPLFVEPLSPAFHPARLRLCYCLNSIVLGPTPSQTRKNSVEPNLWWKRYSDFPESPTKNHRILYKINIATSANLVQTLKIFFTTQPPWAWSVPWQPQNPPVNVYPGSRNALTGNDHPGSLSIFCLACA